MASKFVVIGSPGQGKSTVLNEIAGEDIFDVASTGQSCTQIGGEWERKNFKEILIDDGKKKHALQLIDTPGFPDPNPDNAATYYDYVVQKCNEPINGVIFCMKPERECGDILERYKTLLQEFTRLTVPLIVIMNGTEPQKKKREKEEDYQNRRLEGLKNFRDTGRRIMRESNLHAREILVSYCIDDLADLGKDVARILSSVKPSPSNVRTYKEVCDELDRCKDSKYAAESKINREKERIQKCRQDINSLQEEISTLKAWAVGTCWVPFAGAVAAAVLLAKVKSKSDRVRELYEEIGDAEGAQRAAGNVEELEKMMKEAEATYGAMRKYLGAGKAKK